MRASVVVALALTAAACNGSVRPDCVSVVATFDNSGVLVNPLPGATAYLSLQASGPSNLNPTPFSILDEDADPRDTCAGP